jgi:predicted small integral membrane protein
VILRTAKVLLVAAAALFYTLVVFNNTTDYGTNYQFVHHILLMDTTFPSNHGMWRAMHSPIADTAFYDIIIAWEALTALLCWIGAAHLALAIRQPASGFNTSKRWAIAALMLGMMLCFVAFISIGGEWFLMWQSMLWNGQEAAFHMFASLGIVLLLLVQPDTENQP